MLARGPRASDPHNHSLRSLPTSFCVGVVSFDFTALIVVDSAENNFFHNAVGETKWEKLLVRRNSKIGGRLIPSRSARRILQHALRPNLSGSDTCTKCFRTTVVKVLSLFE